MRITPLDIIQKEFAINRKGGFEPDEVRAFLDRCREGLEEVLKENRRLQETISERDRELARMKAAEGEVRETLNLARKLSDDLQGNARREADLVVGEARLEAQRIISSSHDEHGELMAEVHRLKGHRLRLLAELRAVVQTHARLLDEIEKVG